MRNKLNDWWHLQSSLRRLWVLLPIDVYAAGNRLTDDGQSQTVTAGNRLLSDGVYTYQYDAEGNRVRRTKISDGSVREYAWDHRNRLIAVTDRVSLGGTATKSVQYVYDALDNRVARILDADGDGTGGPTAEYFVYDGENVLVEYTDADAAGATYSPVVAQRYLYGPGVDAILASDNRAGGVLWALADHEGSVRDVISYNTSTNTATVENHIQYSSFGEIVDETDDTVEFRFSYTGREYDAAVDLYYYRARWYDAAVGRFISEDPAGFTAGDANLYRYVGNNPMTLTDPSGLCWNSIKNTASTAWNTVSSAVTSTAAWNTVSKAVSTATNYVSNLFTGSSSSPSYISSPNSTYGTSSNWMDYAIAQGPSNIRTDIPDPVMSSAIAGASVSSQLQGTGYMLGTPQVFKLQNGKAYTYITQGENVYAATAVTSSTGLHAWESRNNGLHSANLDATTRPIIEGLLDTGVDSGRLVTGKDGNLQFDRSPVQMWLPEGPASEALKNIRDKNRLVQSVLPPAARAKVMENLQDPRIQILANYAGVDLEGATNAVTLSYSDIIKQKGTEIVVVGVTGRVVGAAGAKVAKAVSGKIAKLIGIKSAYEIASQGGKHAGQLKQFQSWSTKSVKKSIDSFEKNIASHQAIIKNPTIKVANWDSLSKKHQKSLIEHWKGDIKRAKELKGIAEEVIKSRNN